MVHDLSLVVMELTLDLLTTNVATGKWRWCRERPRKDDSRLPGQTPICNQRQEFEVVCQRFPQVSTSTFLRSPALIESKTNHCFDIISAGKISLERWRKIWRLTPCSWPELKVHTAPLWDIFTLWWTSRRPNCWKLMTLVTWWTKL